MSDATTWLIEVIHVGGSSLAGRTQTFAGPVVRLGRRNDNHVAFDPELDRKVSGYHAEIELRADGSLTIRETGAQNGVYVNGVRISGPLRVGPGDAVRLGQSGPEMRLRSVRPDAAPMGEQTIARVVGAAAAGERRKSRRLVLATAAAAAVGIVLLAWWAKSRTSDLERRQDTIAEGQKQLGQRLGQVDTKLDRTGAPDWAALVARYQESIFLCVGQGADGKGGIGTAFVVDARGILATNAHVAKMLLEMQVRVAVQNRTGKFFAIRRIRAHPGFTTPDSPDVALIELDQPLPTLTPLPLADDATLAGLQVGTALGTLGYPGELSDAYFAHADPANERLRGAVATFKEGRVSRLTDWRAQACEPADVRIVQHSASLSGGTSGSPMFTADGQVVAINNAGLDAMVLVADPAGSRQGGVARMPSGAQIGFAIRIDELRRFITDTGW